MGKGSLLDDLDRLPKVIVPDENLLQALVNCYEFCRQNFNLLEAARFPPAEFADIHFRLRMVFFGILLNQERDRRLSMRDISVLRQTLRSKRKEEAVMRVAALLKALSLSVAYIPGLFPCYVSASLELGGATIHIAQGQVEPYGLSIYHPGLELGRVN